MGKIKVDTQTIYDLFLQIINDDDPEEFLEKYEQLLEDQKNFEELLEGASTSIPEKAQAHNTLIITTFLIKVMDNNINSMIKDGTLYVDEDKNLVL